MKRYIFLFLITTLCFSKYMVKDFNDFVIAYDDDTFKVKWAFYVMTKENFVENVPDKRPPFYEFTNKNFGTDRDYAKSGYDRGHLVPGDHFKKSAESYKKTFTYLNVVPMFPSVNRGSWKKVEMEVERFVKIYDTVAVYTGPIYSDEKKIGGNILVPKFLFKAYYVKSKNFKRIIGRICTNDKSKEFSNVSVDEIEKKIGYDLDFSKFIKSKKDEENLESKNN